MHGEAAGSVRKHKVKVHSGKALILFMERCYQLYEQKMYQVAYGILHDSGAAEDAVQDAFLKLMKGKVYFEDAASDDCKKYMITVIKHSAIDIYNRNKREQEVLYFCGEDAHLQKAVIPDRKEEEADLKELIAGLDPSYYAVVECLALRNMSVKETSAKLDISEANVRKRFERAKKKLKQVKQRKVETGKMKMGEL